MHCSAGHDQRDAMDDHHGIVVGGSVRRPTFFPRQLTSPNHEASTVTHFVPEDQRSYHAGGEQREDNRYRPSGGPKTFSPRFP